MGKSFNIREMELVGQHCLRSRELAINLMNVIGSLEYIKQLGILGYLILKEIILLSGH
jgi:hypothetical protein